MSNPKPPTYLDLATLGKGDALSIVEYVGKTGSSSLYLTPTHYYDLFNACRFVCPGSHTMVYLLNEGQTSEGYPYFTVAGIKFIMLCGEKLENIHLLK